MDLSSSAVAAGVNENQFSEMWIHTVVSARHFVSSGIFSSLHLVVDVVIEIESIRSFVQYNYHKNLMRCVKIYGLLMPLLATQMTNRCHK